LVSLHHSGNLSGFWALWFCQDHHVASLFIVRRPILKREIKHIRINLSLSTWFFFVPFSSLSKLEGINMILTWATFPWASNNGSSHYMIKTSLLIHVTPSLWINRDWHVEICDSPWLVWYLRFKHPLALLHHIQYRRQDPRLLFSDVWFIIAKSLLILLQLPSWFTHIFVSLISSRL
jgi:hypothetical protein